MLTSILQHPDRKSIDHLAAPTTLGRLGLKLGRANKTGTKQLLKANEDTNSAVKNELSPPIVGANVIRILPYSQHLRTACLRFELHGCPYDGK